jgi:pyrimidine-nucleoside phosphorylase
MVIQHLIERKRDGGELSQGEWHDVVRAFTSGAIPDYQMAALLMAVTVRGMGAAELPALCEAMLASGSRLDFTGWSTPRADKHSTGGVGDKVSLILAPLVATCGVAVPMMSGRGLGHTGGTTDKLESIPGFRTDLTLAEVAAQVRRIGVAMFGQSNEIAPADGKMYALRDVTGTVPSIPLIAASIMSKKLAEGLNALVLDVKTGSGAFLPGQDRALELAQTMIGLGESHGCPTTALLSAMDRPLGRAIGNSLELEEALQTLEGSGPQDLQILTRALAVEMLVAAGGTSERAAIARRVEEALDSGKALDTFRRMVEAQGGNPAIVDDPGILPQAEAVEIYEAPVAGTVTRVEPRRLGQALVELGGGRRVLGEPINHGVGFVVTVKPGTRVAAGEPIASVFARDSDGVQLGMRALSEAILIGESVRPLPLISHRVTARGVEGL